eukprot:PhM_4_TR11902/c0_g2_i1/m.27173
MSANHSDKDDVSLRISFLRCLQARDIIGAAEVAMRLEASHPDDENLVLFKQLIIEATEKYSARREDAIRRHDDEDEVGEEAEEGVDKGDEESEDEVDDTDDGFDWDNLGTAEAIEKLKALGIMK